MIFASLLAARMFLGSKVQQKDLYSEAVAQGAGGGGCILPLAFASAGFLNLLS